MKGETMLVLKTVSKTFCRNTAEKRALCEVGLTLEKGDFVTVIGSNGAGKSTLFQALAGAFFIDRGMDRWMERTSPYRRSIKGAE